LEIQKLTTDNPDIADKDRADKNRWNRLIQLRGFSPCLRVSVVKIPGLSSANYQLPNTFCKHDKINAYCRPACVSSICRHAAVLENKSKGKLLLARVLPQ
jgi:hypothetical protein